MKTRIKVISRLGDISYIPQVRILFIWVQLYQGGRLTSDFSNPQTEFGYESDARDITDQYLKRNSTKTIKYL